ncbi:MAG: 50S ribosomal protein L18 [Deltaproteobacteria bacterium]|nr:50S ribosomal protein L18 [bacterium]MCB9477356.1 50S ribosomal protein L18 [Deltaproteobacteria bacterium]MCB9479008.1 50S ribosomal protein L18 [Deltaproteobacteria bacterium]MCB9487784.1 50S ribosomal protein L18 [Deltaproteobacteria bacterium]
MSYKNENLSPRQYRQRRVRKKVRGTSERPRLCVFRSTNHIYVQAIDDETGVTLASASSREKGFEVPAAEGESADGRKIRAGAKVGEEIAKRLQEKGVGAVVFDRNGFLYHGRVKAVAQGARKGGLAF